MVEFPLSLVFVTVVVVHRTFSLLVVAIPQAVILVVVGKVVCTLSVLLVLKPLSFVFLTVEEGINSKTLAFSLFVVSLIPVTVLVSRFSFAMWLSSHHFTTIVTTVLCDAGTHSDFLAIG